MWVFFKFLEINQKGALILVLIKQELYTNFLPSIRPNSFDYNAVHVFG